VLGGAVKLECNRPCALEVAPLRTVSQSEAGFEKIMQAVTLRLVWRLPAGSHDVGVQLAFVRDDATVNE
jgi:hypothetical protein